MRFIDRNIFDSFKIRKKHYERRWLNWNQLRVLEKKTFHTPMLNLVRDLFVFCCYTGMAPIDMQRLCPDQIYIGFDNLNWLSYVRKKSNITAIVPLLSQPLALINKYKNEDVRQTIFPNVSNQVLNKNLKLIGEICEFSDPLTFYMARYTFATTVTLSQGVPITSIKGMLGHRKLESTLYYARTTDNVIGLDMRLLQKRLDKMP